MKATRLASPRRCSYAVEKLPWEWREVRGNEDEHCPNYVNQQRPRREYWRRPNAERMCWAYICDLCWGLLLLTTEYDYEGWPTDDTGRFIKSMECSFP